MNQYINGGLKIEAVNNDNNNCSLMSLLYSISIDSDRQIGTRVLRKSFSPPPSFLIVPFLLTLFVISLFLFFVLFLHTMPVLIDRGKTFIEATLYAV